MSSEKVNVQLSLNDVEDMLNDSIDDLVDELIDDEKIKSQLMNEIRLAKNIYEIIQEQFSKGIENE